MNFLHFMNVVKKNQDITSLNRGLSEYGLSPADWQIRKVAGTEYKIIHRSEPNFVFLGKIKFENGRKKWGSIQLKAI
ncbi:hypothetical protein K2P97_13405 [bacterium]|nr:hypothetical protein [bacterium]